jgi:CheY-like chemotaxis protein
MAIEFPTVLVVEDEPIVRMYECELAEGAGFHTLEAADAEEALQQLEETGQVEVLLTDIRMPGALDGFDLVDIVREKWPDVKIVVASGHLVGLPVERQPNTVFLSKPFTAAQLVSALLSLY